MNSKVQDWHWWEIIILVALVAMAPVTWRFANSKVLLPILCALMLIGFHYFESLSSDLKRAYTGFLIIIVLVFGANTVKIMRLNVINPPEWDLGWFWIFGKVAARGENFYKPQYAHQLAEVSQPTQEFVKELYFWYPPPTMFLIAPMGWFDLHTGVVFWYVIYGGALVCCIYLLWKIFLPGTGWIGLLWVSAFLLLLQPTITTIRLGQTNFLVLLLILIFWKSHDRLVGGIPLALGIFVKLYLAAMFLYLLLKGKWKLAVSTIVSMLVICLFTLLVFGSNTFFSYFSENPNSHTPNYLYTEITNQSLLATVLRMTQYSFSGHSPLMHPIFIVAALLLTGITAWAVFSVKKCHEELAILLTLTLALLIYPASLDHYGVMLVLPLFYFWQHRKELPGKPVGIIVLMLLIICLSTIGHYQFIANVTTWLILVGISWKISQGKFNEINPTPSFERK